MYINGHACLLYSMMLHYHMYIIFIFFNVLYICIQYVNHQYKTMYILLLSFYVSSDYYKTIHSSSNTLWYIWLYISGLSKHISQHFVVHVVISVCPFTPKIVGIFYMQGYKVKEKTAIVPHCTPSFKTQWAPCYIY